MNATQPHARPPHLKRWALAGTVLILAGIVAAVITHGGTDNGGGERVLAASQATVHGIHYRVVASTVNTNASDTPNSAFPLYFSEYVGTKPKLVHRFLVPDVRFFRDSVVASLTIAPGPGKSARIVLSWYPRSDQATRETRSYRMSPSGFRLY